MKTDISRNTFHSSNNYSSVRRQQGRVDLDADWNEQVDIQNNRSRLLTVDSLGPVGAPAHEGGFLLTPTGDAADLTVSSGRFYVNGLLINNSANFNLTSQPDLPGVTLPTTDGDYLAYLKVYERGVTALEAPEIREIALGGPDTTTRTQVIRQVHVAPITASEIDSRTVPPEWNAIISRNPGRMSARTQADGASDPCAVGTRGGYTGLDNVMYRVEIHDGGPAGSATYKWSRDNGTLVTEWLELEADTLTLRSIGNDNVLNFAPGQWVEISDDGMELEGTPGTLAQIIRVEGRRITINPDNIRHFPGSSGTLDINEFSRGTRKVRRWDFIGASAAPAVPDGAGGEVWITLENGIEVKFDDLASGKEYRTGDYWMFPARADNNNIEWACDNNGNLEHEPHGTIFHYARLAFLNLTAGAWSVIADAREIFPGLTNEELTYVGGDGQLSVPGETLERPLEVRVTRGATPVADAKVRFTVSGGTGTIEDAPGGTSGTTLDIKADSEGIARVYWTLMDANAGQSVHAVLLDEADVETPLYVVFGAGSGVASGIQYTPVSSDSSIAGTTNVQEALDALADNKVNRSGDTMTGNLTVNADLEVTGNMTIRGDVIARDAQQQAGDVLLGDDDIDRVIIHGTLQSNHTSGALEIEGPVHINATDPTKSPLRVDGPSTGGSPRLYRLPLNLDHTNSGATTLNDYQLLITVDTATPIAAGRMQADGADILFEDEGGHSLPFWIEADINTAATRIWIRLPQIAAGATVNINMLYGNAGVASQSSAAAVFEAMIPNVEAAYHLDEGVGTNLTDLSPNGVDATLSGAVPPAWTAGRFGSGLNFAGTGGDSNAVTPPRSWGFSTTATISAWINVSGAHSEIADGIVAVSANNATNELMLALSAGRIALYNHPSPSNYNLLSGTTPVNTGQWIHVVGVLDGGITQSDMRLYINGVPEATTYSVTGSPGPIQDTADRVLIMGRRTIANQNYYHALLDEVRVYSAALSEAEIAAMAQGYGYLSPALPGVELIRRAPATIEPSVTAGAEEANPLSDTPIIFAQETSGNVGIGTDNPDQKLAVDGIIHTLQGGIQFPDGTIQTTAGGAGGGGGDPLALGTIMAWHRDFAGAPEVPEGWVECNGQVLDDPDSPYDGLVIPNLNGEGRFLRGGDSSGTMQDDQFQGHRHFRVPEGIHEAFLHPTPSGVHSMAAGGGTSYNGAGAGTVTGDPVDGTQGPIRQGSETRPTNMSVVWIMKVKETGKPGLWTPNSEGIHYSAGKVSVGTNKTDEQLTVTGAISLEEKVLEPETSDDFGKIYVRENDLSTLNLDGVNQYVSMPPLGNSAVGDYTIALWFKYEDALRAVGDHSFLFDTRREGVEGPSVESAIEARGNGEFNLVMATGYNSGGNHFRQKIENPTGVWHHVAITRQGANLGLYLDGRLLSANPDEGGTPQADTYDWNVPWRIASRSSTPSSVHRTFPGKLDDFGIWTRALSEDEIAALHNGGRGSDVTTGFASSLIAFYPMSQSATPGQLEDLSGGNLHGTIQNGAQITSERVGTLYFKDGFGNVTALAGGGDSYRTGGSGNQVPLGTIMAWHKSFTNTPAIPDGWVECDGQPLDDPASPYHGQTIPNLNDPQNGWNSNGSFLRGGTTSGDFQTDQMQKHIHGVYPHAGTFQGEFPINRNGAGGADGSTRVAQDITSTPVNPPVPTSYGSPRTGDETRPANMSVVWIMKVRETDRDRGLWRESGQDIYFDDGKVGVGVETANTKLHVSSNDLEEAPFRIDAQVTLQGVQGRLYRAPISLENTDTNDLIDQQVPLTLDTATLVTSGKMRFDGADILFTDEDGKTLLPHFIERDMNTVSTKVWVRVPSIPAGETRRVFIQYGKSDATDIASADATFLRIVDGTAVAWNLDESSGNTAVDASGNGYDGNVAGARAPGYRGDGISVTSNAGVDGLTAKTWGFSNSGTISAWIKPTAGFGGTIATLQTGTVIDEFALFGGFAEAGIAISNAGGQFAARASTSPTPAGQWSHVVGIIDGPADASEYRLYINGVREQGAITLSGNPSPISDVTPRRFHVGVRPDRPSEFFTGEIDVIRLYDRALTDQEVADLYANDSTFSPAMPGKELVHRLLPVPPTITMEAEEPNPVSGSPVLFAQNLTGNIGIGTDEPGAKLHIAGEAGVDGIMFPDGTLQTTAGGPGGGGDSTPLGTIIAWHKNLSGTPAIPEGWVECNGQVLSDSDSPFDGQVIPNLNGDARFLRGGTTSGTLQEDAFQGHRHATSDLLYGFEQIPGATLSTNPFSTRFNHPNILDPIDDGVNGPPRTADETRPINMSVVWIMKVKQVDGQSGLWTPNTDGIRYDEGKVSVGTAASDEQLNVGGAISLEEKVLEPDTTEDFGKIYVRENDLSHLSLNGTDQYVSMPGLSTAPIGDFTIAVWTRLRKPNTSGPSGQSFILDLRGDGSLDTQAPGFILHNDEKGLTLLEHFVDWPTAPDSNFRVHAGNLIGEWHHMAMTRVGDKVRVYLDGRFMTDEPDNNPSVAEVMTWNSVWRVGTWTVAPGTEYYFNGDMDDLGLWSRALSADEIAALHNGGRGSDVPTAFASSLLAFYPMSESATPGQLDDASGNNLHGTIHNGAGITPERVGSLYFKDGFGNVTALAGGGDSYRTGGSGNQVPVGTIMAWHKSFENTPTIPDGWVQCDGQTLDDPASPYHGQVIPDLNNPKESWNTKGSFLRGDTQSGDFEDDEFQGHWHEPARDQGISIDFATGVGFANGPTHPNQNTTEGVRDPLTDGTNGTPRTNSETHPVNMSVVWIMKVRETDRDRGLWRESGEDIYFDDGKVGIGVETADAKLHISAETSTEAPLRIDAQTTLQGVQGRLYRTPITLNNTDTEDLVDYQVLLSVDTQSLVTAGKLRFDGGDLLFVDEDGKTVLPHYIESGINTGATEIWVRVPLISAGANRIVFMQYGKSDATSQSSAAATFVREIADVTAAYTFDEGSGGTVTDYSGNANGGNIVGPAWSVDRNGNADRALVFDGVDDRIRLGHSDSLSIASSISLSAWIFCEGPGTGSQSAQEGCIISKWLTTTNASYRVYVNHSAGRKLTLALKESGGTVHHIDSIGAVEYNQWHHVAATYDKAGGNISFYIDGMLDSVENPGSFDLSQTTLPAFIGCFNESSDGSTLRGFFRGTIDEARIHNRALTSAEIAELHAPGADPTIKPGSDIVRRADATPPALVVGPEEPNPVSGSPILFAQNLTGNIGIGTDDPLARLHIAGTAGVDGIMFPDGSLQTTASQGGGDSTPVGTIIAWHKSLTGTPAIPEGWVECNGQTLNDEDSPYHGEIIPDLNGDARFLRGGGTSGSLQTDAFQGHYHNNLITPVQVSFTGGTSTLPPGTTHQDGGVIAGIPMDDGTNGTPRTADETRPVNMSVVWIMKVKQTGNQAWLNVPGGIAYTGGRVGIGTSDPSHELDVNGTVQCVTLTQTSDARRKKNVSEMSGALDIVDRLRGVRFEWDNAGAGGISPPHGPQVGLIAQEVEDVLPEVVTTDRNGYKSVEYGKLVAVLIEAIKELKQT